MLFIVLPTFAILLFIFEEVIGDYIVTDNGIFIALVDTILCSISFRQAITEHFDDFDRNQMKTVFLVQGYLCWKFVGALAGMAGSVLNGPKHSAEVWQQLKSMLIFSLAATVTWLAVGVMMFLISYLAYLASRKLKLWT